VKDIVGDLISLNNCPLAQEKKEKQESKISSMLSAFGGAAKSTSPMKETSTEKRVRERRERKEREEQKRLDKEAAAKEEEERIAQ
jgi:hypothetical protein